jgi:hypothetical protein
MQSQSSGYHSRSRRVGRMEEDTDEVKYQRAASILRDFHSTNCCPPLNVIHEDPDHDMNMNMDIDNDQNQRVMSKSDTVACLTALAQQEEEAFRKEQEDHQLLASDEEWGYFSAAMLSKMSPLASPRVNTGQSPFSSRRQWRENDDTMTTSPIE